MKRLASLRRPSFIVGGVLVLVYLGLCIGAAPDKSPVQVILPRWTDHIATMGLALFVFSEGIAVATQSGRRVIHLIALLLGLPIAVLAVGAVSFATQRAEIDRVRLRDGRVFMMTLEPVATDTVFALWEPQGWRWRSFPIGENLTYSEDGSFTNDPSVVLAGEERYVLVRRGGIWTDCWTTEAQPRSCIATGDGLPHTKEGWLRRSASIAEVVGLDPS